MKRTGIILSLAFPLVAASCAGGAHNAESPAPAPLPATQSGRAPAMGINLPASVTFDDEQAIKIAANEILRVYGGDGYWREVPLKATRDRDGNWQVVGTRTKPTLDYARNKYGKRYSDADLIRMIENGQIVREGGYSVVIVDGRSGKVLSISRKGE